METPLQISFRDMEPSPAVEADIRAKAAKLDRVFDRIVSARVVVAQRNRHQHKGKLYAVNIVLRVPGREIVVDRAGPQDHAHEDVYVAIRDSFDAATRQLEDHVRVARGDVKAHAVPDHGRVARLFADEGYGFIETSDGRELYFSRDNVAYPTFDDLAPGTEVQFIEAWAAEGAQAKRVSAGKHRA